MPMKIGLGGIPALDSGFSTGMIDSVRGVFTEAGDFIGEPGPSSHGIISIYTACGSQFGLFSVPAPPVTF